MLTKKEIQSLWMDDSFSGSFTGAYAFYKALKDSGQASGVSLARVKRALEDLDMYQMHFNGRVSGQARRHIQTSGSNIDFSADIMEMPSDDEGYKYALIMRDQFNLMIYARPLKDKSSASVKQAFIHIMDASHVHPSTLSTDQGTEFVGLQWWFRKQKIYHILRRGANKASVAEHAIRVIKGRLYRALSSGHKDSWSRVLASVVDNINQTPNKGLGGLVPFKVKESIHDPLVRSRKTSFPYPLW